MLLARVVTMTGKQQAMPQRSGQGPWLLKKKAAFWHEPGCCRAAAHASSVRDRVVVRGQPASPANPPELTWSVFIMESRSNQFVRSLPGSRAFLASRHGNTRHHGFGILALVVLHVFLIGAQQSPLGFGGCAHTGHNVGNVRVLMVEAT